MHDVLEFLRGFYVSVFREIQRFSTSSYGLNVSVAKACEMLNLFYSIRFIRSFYQKKISLETDRTWYIRHETFPTNAHQKGLTYGSFSLTPNIARNTFLLFMSSCIETKSIQEM